MRVSAGFFDALRHPGKLLAYAAVTLAANLPSSTALHTRPCRLHPQIAGSNCLRPWLSAWNQAAVLPSRSRFGPPRTLPPELAKKKLSCFFSFAIPSYRRHKSSTRSVNTLQYAGVLEAGSLLHTAQWQSGRLPSGGHPFV